MYRIEFYDGEWYKSANCLQGCETLDSALGSIAECGSNARYRVLDEKARIMWEGTKAEAKTSNREPAATDKPYYVEFFAPYTQLWVATRKKGMRGKLFATKDEAIANISDYGDGDSSSPNYRVMAWGTYPVWTGSRAGAIAHTQKAKSGVGHDDPMWTVVTATITSTKGTKDMLNEPLTVPVAKVIEQLETALEVIQMERNELEAKAQESREELYRALHDLSNDQLAKLVEGRWGEGSTKAAKNVEQMKDDGQLEYPESKPTAKETDLERLLRVLRISSEKTVNVDPAGPLYQLL